MKRGIFVFAVGLALASSALAQESGGPMSTTGFGQGPAARQGFIYSRNAIAKGDILTVTIAEHASGNFSATTTTTKKDSNAVSASTLPLANVVSGPILGQLLGGSASIPRQLINGLLGASSTGANSSVAGAGTTTTQGDYTATISVTVKDVMPNGNLVIEGQRFVKVNKELQSIVLSGVVRSDDVLPDNTVPSSKVAQARIYSEGKGAIADRQRRGFLTKVLEWLF